MIRNKQILRGNLAKRIEKPAETKSPTLSNRVMKKIPVCVYAWERGNQKIFEEGRRLALGRKKTWAYRKGRGRKFKNIYHKTANSKSTGKEVPDRNHLYIEKGEKKEGRSLERFGGKGAVKKRLEFRGHGTHKSPKNLRTRGLSKCKRLEKRGSKL